MLTGMLSKFIYTLFIWINFETSFLVTEEALNNFVNTLFIWVFVLFGPCLVLQIFCKIFQILRHIESLDVCMKH